jgi:hypothetical protein
MAHSGDRPLMLKMLPLLDLYLPSVLYPDRCILCLIWSIAWTLILQISLPVHRFFEEWTRAGVDGQKIPLGIH